MDELKRQMIEAVAALDAHDEETLSLRRSDPWLPAAYWDKRNTERARLEHAFAGVARCVVAQWKAEDEQTPCGAEFAGHVCGRKGAHGMHEDPKTGQRWPGIEVTP